MKNLNLRLLQGTAVAGALVVSSGAYAQTTPTTSITTLASAVDFTSVSSALLTIGAAIISLLVTWQGIKFLFKSVKSA